MKCRYCFSKAIAGYVHFRRIVADSLGQKLGELYEEFGNTSFPICNSHFHTKIYDYNSMPSRHWQMEISARKDLDPKETIEI